MRYVLARYETEYHARMYRIYVTDALMVAFGLNERYASIFIPEETRTPEEIIGGITDKLRDLHGSV